MYYLDKLSKTIYLECLCILEGQHPFRKSFQKIGKLEINVQVGKYYISTACLACNVKRKSKDTMEICKPDMLFTLEMSACMPADVCKDWRRRERETGEGEMMEKFIEQMICGLYYFRKENFVLLFVLFSVFRDVSPICIIHITACTSQFVVMCSSLLIANWVVFYVFSSSLVL